MRKKKDKVELEIQDGTPVLPYAQGGTWQGGTRLDEICKQLGTRAFAASIAGISDDQLAGYIYGRSKPGFLPLARLCLAAGKSLDWLATGIEPPKESTTCALNVEALTWALEIVEKVGAGLPPERKARLGAAIYSLYIRSGEAVDPALVEEVVRSARGDSSQTM